MRGRRRERNVEKRARIKGETLVVGLDIGSDFNAMVMMNKEGEILGRYPKVYNSRKGFDYFKGEIERKRKEGYKDVIIGMEPTGHYWRKIGYFGQEQGYEVRFVRTTALKHQRELDETSWGKSDIRDAITITNIVREGKYLETKIRDDVYRQLRTLGKVRERIQRYNTGSKYALKAVIEDYFPELKGIFWSMKAKGLWAILERCPFPEDVIKMREEEIAEVIGEASRRKGRAEEKAKKIYELAKESIGLKKIGIADRFRVKKYLEEVKRTEDILAEIKREMGKLLKEVPEAKYLLSIPGVGKLTTAIVLGELGGVENFDNWRGIVKYAGYDPISRDSGKRVGGKWISKKGRYLLRKYLYFMSMRVIHRSLYFRSYYKRKLKERNRFGQEISKKEGICAVAIKLMKVMFALMRDKRKFGEIPPRFVRKEEKDSGIGGMRLVYPRRPLRACAN